MQIASDRFEAVPFEAPEAPSSIRRAVQAIARIPDRLARIHTGWTLTLLVVLGTIAIAGAGYGIMQIRQSLRLAEYRQTHVGHEVLVLPSKRLLTGKVLDADLRFGEINLQVQCGSVIAWMPVEMLRLTGR